jgi:hypothetical protein
MSKEIDLQVFRTAREWAQITGAAGGRKAAQNMTPEARAARARKASRAAVKARRKRAKEAKQVSSEEEARRELVALKYREARHKFALDEAAAKKAGRKKGEKP